MNKILIIEPHRMLQQAMMLALAPEYAVRVSATVDAATLDGCDAVIIDAAALRELDGTAAEQQLTLLQSWRGPTVVIDESDAVGDGAAVAWIKAPITREALKNALAEVLNSAVAPTDGGDAGDPRRAPPVSAESASADEKTTPGPGDADKAPLIELVDIVEEKS